MYLKRTSIIKQEIIRINITCVTLIDDTKNKTRTSFHHLKNDSYYLVPPNNSLEEMNYLNLNLTVIFL